MMSFDEKIFSFHGDVIFSETRQLLKSKGFTPSHAGLYRVAKYYQAHGEEMEKMTGSERHHIIAMIIADNINK